VPRARSSALGGQLVAHERHRRGVIFGVDGGVADGAGLVGGGRIDGTGGEIDGGARLAGLLPVAAARCLRGRQQNNKRGGGTLVR
jgi:hypothetical protein